MIKGFISRLYLLWFTDTNVIMNFSLCKFHNEFLIMRESHNLWDEGDDDVVEHHSGGGELETGTEQEAEE